jgi:hypothetical protein
MTVQEIAKLERVGERQIQRYLHDGFKGHVLRAVRIGRGFVIALEDYREWRRACGFDEPEAQQPEVPKVTLAEVIAEPEPERPAYPPYPFPADPHGQLTNVPHEHSRNMPHPLACRDYFQEQARRMKAQLRG